MATKTRAELKLYFVKNAIPTQGNYADLIDAQLNRSDDGVFKLVGEPLSVVAADEEQRRVLQLHGVYPAASPDWVISLNPRQDPGNPATSRAGLGITGGAGGPRLFVDKATGKVGVGTNDPQAELDVRGDARLSGTLTVGVGVDLAGAKLHVDGNLRIKDCSIEPRSSSIDIHQEDWQVPTLGNGWVNFGAPYNPAAYFKDSCGIVHLRGMIKGGALSSTGGDKPVFTLPAGYRPAGQELHGACCSGSSTDNPRMGRVDIKPDGKVSVVGGSNSWITLDGISFRAAG